MYEGQLGTQHFFLFKLNITGIAKKKPYTKAVMDTL